MSNNIAHNLYISVLDENFAKQTADYLNEICFLGASVEPQNNSGYYIAVRQEETEYPYDNELLDQVKKIVSEINVLKGLLVKHELRYNLKPIQ